MDCIIQARSVQNQMMAQRHRLGDGPTTPSSHYAANIFIAFVVAITFLLSVTTIHASMSGFYVDNGFDQTVMHRMLTPDDAQHVEHEILELLGLPDRPTGRKLRHPSMRKSAPKFLMDVYRRLSEQENGGGHSRRTRSALDENLITATDRNAIEESDVIRTFLSKSELDWRLCGDIF